MAEIKDIWMHAHHMIRSARQILNEDLHPLNLNSAEGNILLHMLTQGHEMGQEELVAQMDISKPAVSRTLDSLAAKGYVTCEQDPDDKRAHLVRLTDSARVIGPEVVQIYNRLYTMAFRDLSKEEIDQFIKLFARLSQNFTRE